MGRGIELEIVDETTDRGGRRATLFVLLLLGFTKEDDEEDGDGLRLLFACCRGCRGNRRGVTESGWIHSLLVEGDAAPGFDAEPKRLESPSGFFLFEMSPKARRRC